MQSSERLATIILAAGKGSRMQSDLPKVMHPIGGLPMVNHVINAAMDAQSDRVIGVIGADMPDVADAFSPHETVVQDKQLGTGHAVKSALEKMQNSFHGDYLVLFGDMPMIDGATLGQMVDEMQNLSDVQEKPGVVVTGTRVTYPAHEFFGRLILDNDDCLTRIVEYKDATPDQRDIDLVNCGMMLIDGDYAHDWLSRVDNDNASNEFYLTDIIQIARNNGRDCLVHEIPAIQSLGANTRGQLARLETEFQNQCRSQAMDQSVTMIDPNSVYFSWDTSLGRDVLIEPHVFFGPGVTIDDRVRVHAFSHLTDCHVREAAEIGPFARLRPGADIGQDSVIGNFVEVKNSRIGRNTKAKHLAVLSDAEIGDQVNIGAGTITCNYDGFTKHNTIIGDNAFIGSNTALVAPVSIGSGAIVGAGSTVINDVEDNCLTLTRSDQTDRPEGAIRYRQKNIN